MKPHRLQRRVAGRYFRQIKRSHWAIALAVWVVAVAGGAATYRYIHHHGVVETGDEPHYLVVARAVSHLTVHPLDAYKADIRSRSLFDWPPGTPTTGLSLQTYNGPHGMVSDHPIGLSVLLAPFVAVGGTGLARLATIAMSAAGVVFALARAARLTRLGRAGTVVLAVAMAAPSLWLAITQIYPDFLTGVLLAVAGVVVWAVEETGVLGAVDAIASAVSLSVLPWLHQQNLVGAVLLVAALGYLARRAGRWRGAAVVGIVSVASWVLLIAFNQYEYGHPLGLPQPFPYLNGSGVTEILGLLFDRHQGMFVQVPTALIGLVGLGMARRRAPLSAVAVLLAAASLVYLNGTFTHAPYGGLSFAGRFQWSSVVPLLPWAALPLAAMVERRNRLLAVAGGAAALWILQAIPIVVGHHVYFNQMSSGLPWDVATYPGWWGPVDRVLPVLAPYQDQFGRPWYGFVLAVAVSVAAVIVLSAAARPRRRAARTAVSVGVPAVAALALMAALLPAPLPGRPLVYKGAILGSPLVGGPAGTKLFLPLDGVAAGRYEIDVDYSMSGPGGSTFEEFCAPLGESGPPPAGGVAGLEGGGARTASLSTACRSGLVVYFGTSVSPGATVTIRQARLFKRSD